MSARIELVFAQEKDCMDGNCVSQQCRRERAAVGRMRCTARGTKTKGKTIDMPLRQHVWCEDTNVRQMISGQIDFLQPRELAFNQSIQQILHAIVSQPTKTQADRLRIKLDERTKNDDALRGRGGG